VQSIDAQLFKTAFESAQSSNAALGITSSSETAAEAEGDKPSSSAVPQDPSAVSAKETEPVAPKGEAQAAESSATATAESEVHGDKSKEIDSTNPQTDASAEAVISETKTEDVTKESDAAPSADGATASKAE
jgi:hypothetical protein